jgi:hypothetical protein
MARNSTLKGYLGHHCDDERDGTTVDGLNSHRYSSRTLLMQDSLNAGDNTVYDNEY